MALAMLDEAQGASRFGLDRILGEVPPLAHLPELTAVARLCRRGEYAVARKAAILLREENSEVSYLAVRFACGVQDPKAITADLGGFKVALVGHPNQPFDQALVGRAISVLAGSCPREWGLRPSPPTHGGWVEEEAFRRFATIQMEVDDNHANIDRIVWLLREGGADLFFIQPH